MTEDHVDEILHKIDDIIGPPESETEEEHEARRRMVERDAEARRIRKTATRNR